MISEGSCDTEDWSNVAENSALITEINYILLYSNRKQLFEMVIIFHNITVFNVFFGLFFYLIAADSTGTHSLYTRYQDYEIMFHVSTMLPYTSNNTQQVIPSNVPLKLSTTYSISLERK